MRKGIDHFSGYLEGMEPPNPNAPELLQKNSEGEIVDKNGTVYDEDGREIKGVPNESSDPYFTAALKRIQELYRDKPYAFQAALAKSEASAARGKDEEQIEYRRHEARMSKKEGKKRPS